MGEIVTFYSYKGGVGRSMVMANVAHIMAWKMSPRRKVLMIDWDLEAPGLHKFFHDQLNVNFRASSNSFAESLQKKPGLINFLTDIHEFYRKNFPKENLSVMYAETDEARKAFQDAIATYPIDKYILVVGTSGGRREKDDRLFLMKAGDQSSDEFVHLVRTFLWQEFFDRFGSFFTILCQYLAERYDTVLIDSRTGLTDIGDICTRLMPEKLVGVFVPNEQNIEGLSRVMKGSAEFRKNSRDTRSMLLFPLASRIDPSRGQLRRTWWKGGELRDRKIPGYEPQFEKLLAEVYDLDECNLDQFFDSTQVPHDADYAFGEEVAARDPDSGRLGIGFSCANLAQYLTSDLCPWEPLPVDGPKVEAVEVEEKTAGVWIFAEFPQLVLALAAVLCGAGLIAAALFIGTPLSPTTVDVYGATLAISSTTAPGFGAGSITIHAVNPQSVETKSGAIKMPLQAPPAATLQVTRGSLDKAVITLDTANATGNSSAVLTTQGLGQATLYITPLIGGSQSNAKVTQVALEYRFPWSLALTALSGALFGSVVKILLDLPYTESSPLLTDALRLPRRFRLVIFLTSVTQGLFTILIYLALFSTFIISEAKFSLVLIFTLAFFGAYARLIPSTLSRVVSQDQL